MEGNGGQVSRRPFRLRESICGWSISYFVPFISHFYLLLVPLFSPSPSLLPNLFFSGVVLLIAAVVAKFFKLLLKLRASAPALGFFNILFVWSAYLAVLWQGGVFGLAYLLHMLQYLNRRMDHSSSSITFTNPYDNVILNNLKEFLSTQH